MSATTILRRSTSSVRRPSAPTVRATPVASLANGVNAAGHGRHQPTASTASVSAARQRAALTSNRLTSALRAPARQDGGSYDDLPGPALLSGDQIATLRAALAGLPLAVCFGAGVDSTAMLLALRAAGLRPDVITMADTGGEKPGTWAHVERMAPILAAWGWPPIDVCRAITKPTTGYHDLFGNCIANETLPSLAFGMKSCSIRWKAQVQDQFLRGARRGPNARAPHPVWLAAQARGQRITKLIGYDCGKADMRRSRGRRFDESFLYAYPLQLIGWTRADCVRAIAMALGAHMVPIKSACFFCPASKAWELWWLAAEEPALFEAALRLERNALKGRHSRFDAVEFGASWEHLVRNADSFPSTSTCVGLGRSFAWNQWARVNGVVDDEFKVIRSKRAEFLAVSQCLSSPDNALDARSVVAIPRSTTSLETSP